MYKKFLLHQWSKLFSNTKRGRGTPWSTVPIALNILSRWSVVLDKDWVSLQVCLGQSQARWPEWCKWCLVLCCTLQCINWFAVFFKCCPFCTVVNIENVFKILLTIVECCSVLKSDAKFWALPYYRLTCMLPRLPPKVNPYFTHTFIYTPLGEACYNNNF